MIKIVLIEDDDVIRKGYAFLFGNTENMMVVASYGSYEEAMNSIESVQPDIILLDIQLPGTTGLKALPLLKKMVPDSIIIMLTVNDAPDAIFEALSNGAAGYLTKDTAPSRIIEFIKEAMFGGGPLSASVARIVIQSFQKNDYSPLTKRESEILQLIGDGKSRSHIAKELFIDLETVKTHIKNIYLKLDVHSRADAIRLAKNNRFIR